MSEPRTEPRQGEWTLAGKRFAYLEWGPADGTPVLCLHGFPDVPRTYDALAQGLVAAGYRVVAPWMRGYAPSTLAGPFSIEQLAQDVVAFADRVSPDAPLRIIGHDWGAAATYAALQLAPSRFIHAVTLAVPHPMAFATMLATDPGQLRRSWYMGFFHLPKVPEKALARGHYAFVHQLWKAWSPNFRVSRAYLDEVKDCLAASMPSPIGYYRAMFWPPKLAIPRFMEAAKAHHRIRVPTLYLHGENDACIALPPPGLQEKWFVADTKIVLVPRAGHFVQQERVDAVLAETLAWFGRQAGAQVKAAGAWERTTDA